MGALTVLYAFQGTVTDGAGPAGTPLIVQNNTNGTIAGIFGTTAFTSLNSSGIGSGYGGIYELVPNATGGGYTFQNLYSISSVNNGTNPYAGLATNRSNFYGTTDRGGSSGFGTVFSLVRGTGTYQYTYNVLHTFTAGPADGSGPYGGVIYLSNYLYGTTTGGGSSFDGIVYRIPAAGGSLTTLGTFNGTNGDLSWSGLLQSGTTLYGTTYLGGTTSSSGSGDVFSIPLGGGTISNLHPFTGTAPDGANPWSTPIRDSSGNLYVTTASGGLYGYGGVYEITGTTSAALYSFTGGSDGSGPRSALVMDSSGNLYGTTYSGGANGKGVVFKLTP